VVTISLIIVNTLLFLYEVSLGPAVRHLIQEHGLVPAQITCAVRYGEGDLGSAVAPLLTSMFLHGGWWHLIGNMWFLWIFGDNVEDALGSVRFLLFYLLCGVGGGIAQWAFTPASAVPTVGASGAIAGVLGAYARIFPHARVLTVVPVLFFIQLVEVPAVVMLGLWFLLQLFNGSVATLGAPGGGVAWWAHIGGFVGGLLMALPFRPRRIRI
jgi:membrane associated rhomboid family serine protease